MLFGYIKGSSKLTDEQLPRFAETILGAFATLLEDTVMACGTAAPGGMRVRSAHQRG
jgi:hypothetical protein